MAQAAEGVEVRAGAVVLLGVVVVAVAAARASFNVTLFKAGGAVVVAVVDIVTVTGTVNAMLMKVEGTVGVVVEDVVAARTLANVTLLKAGAAVVEVLEMKALLEIEAEAGAVVVAVPSKDGVVAAEVVVTAIVVTVGMSAAIVDSAEAAVLIQTYTILSKVGKLEGAVT
jgi:hypothetical protein